ncbi:hypothetical protein OG453_38235 [Streptomyces sp. NBC_01381]|uniref:hypothetical protein n=1 Tax=Streptomyces sp. NBC_01381 TaxID=2903845 RepID=UPI00224D025C|nr:hypothetical protein [Streptomyces sp. NBC_01381]MCX4672429.1 hypothetical protein [Streptomyces sp. NBC_01381]
MTHKKHVLEREQLEEDRQQFAEQYAQAQEQFRLAQEQFRYEQQKDRESTERANRTAATEGYLAAAKLLGSLNLAQRLGAVYSLARIAGDSPADRAEDLDAVEQVLADLERASPGA